MSWWAAAAPAAAQLVLLVVPGLGVLWLAGVRGLLALVAAPAVSAAGLGAVALVAPLVGVRWGTGLVVLTTVVGWALALGLGIARRRSGRALVVFAPHPRRALAWAAIAVVVAAAVLASPIKAGMVEPHAISQTWDSVFHLNGVQAVRETGNASALGGLAPLYSDGGAHVYYPSLWHSVAALSPGPVPLVANVSTFVLGVAVWLTGLYGLARAAVPSTPAVAVLTPIVASTFFGFPTATLSTSGQWPNGMAVALLPGAAALVLVVARRHLDLAAWLLAGIAVLGVAMAHGSGVFALAVIIGTSVIVLTSRAARRAWRLGRRHDVVLVGAAGGLALVAATFALGRGDLLGGVLDYPRAATASTARGLVEGVLDIPMVSDVAPNYVAAGAALVGAVAVLVRREGRWLVPAWIALVLLVGLAVGPENALRWLSGFWYKSAPRIAALVPVVAAPLGAAGVWALARLVGRREVLAGATAVAVLAVGWGISGGFRAEDRAARFAAAYVPGEIRYGTLVSAEEVSLLRAARETLPADATVVGDPFNGAAYFWAVAGVDVVFPQLGGSGRGPDHELLRQRFGDLHEDPAVCEALARFGATHFYADEPGVIEATDVAASFPGFYGVDVSRGFTEVARAGSARLYEITACA